MKRGGEDSENPQPLKKKSPEDKQPCTLSEHAFVGTFLLNFPHVEQQSSALLALLRISYPAAAYRAKYELLKLLVGNNQIWSRRTITNLSHLLGCDLARCFLMSYGYPATGRDNQVCLFDFNITTYYVEIRESWNMMGNKPSDLEHDVQSDKIPITNFDELLEFAEMCKIHFQKKRKEAAKKKAKEIVHNAAQVAQVN